MKRGTSLKREILRGVLVLLSLPLLVVLFGLAVQAYYLYPMLYTVTDPSNSSFDYEDFRFEYHADLQTTLETMFPNGTPKREIDQILIDYAGAYSSQLESGSGATGRIQYRYSYSNFRNTWATLGTKGISACLVHASFDTSYRLIELEVIRNHC